MKSRLTCLSALLTACASGAPAPAPPPTPAPAPAPAGSPVQATTTTPGGAKTTGTMMLQAIGTGEQIFPKTGPQALKSFVADAMPDETGGECSLSRTTGNGALFVTAFYPTRAASKSQVTITFDSAGHVARYSELRGVVHFERGLRAEQVDSTRRAFDAANRTTSINFDYAVDRAMAMNRGSGKPTVAIVSSVRDMEKLENLQQPAARMERARKLCGV